MENTNQELSLVNNEQFGNLIHLPQILNDNKSRALKAQTAVNTKLQIVQAIDLTKVDAQEMEKHDVELADLQGRLKTQKDNMESARKPHTQFMDSIKTLFTAEEKIVDDLAVKIKVIRNNWQAEKGKRAAEEQKKRDEEIQKKQNEIKERSEKTSAYTNKVLTEIGRLLGLMNDKFNQHTAETIESYEATLKAYKPVLDGPSYEKVLGESTPLSGELFVQLSADYTNKLSTERDRLIELIPSRKAELIRIANDAQAKKEADDRIAREAKEREDALLAEAKEKEEAVSLGADAESMNAVFDVASQAVPIVGISKGTVVKRKYQPTTHAQHISIIQWWVKNCMGQMTMDDLKTKLSFMRTAADKALNSGETIEGVDVVDDYSTRGNIKKTA
jgi:hypothetical protein